MKRLLILLFLLLGCSAIASAKDSARGWCEEGNRPVVTSGLNSTTRVQASHPSCIITVNVHGGGLATIFSDNNGTPLANPFTSQSDGQWQFYSANGRYDVTLSSAGFSQTITYSDILLCDPFETNSTCNNGGTAQAHNLLSTTHLDTIPASPPVQGDLVTAQNLTSPTGTNPSWARLAIGTLGQVLTSTGTDAVWATPTSGGCGLPGTDTGVLSEHPAGICYDSARFTWNDTTFNLQVASTFGANTVGTNNTIILGPANSFANNTFSYVLGDQNNASSSGGFQHNIYVLGSTTTTENLITGNSATVNIGTNDIGKAANSGSGGKNNVSIGFNATFNGQQVTAIGQNSIGQGGATGVEQNGIVLGGSQEPNCVAGPSGACGGTGAGRGSSNGFAIIGDDNLVNQNGTGTANSIYLFGFNNRADTTIGNINVGGAYEFGLDNEIDGSVSNDVVIGGASNTSHNSQGATCLGASDATIWGDLNVATGSGNFQIFGAGNTVTSLNCVAVFGMKVTATASNTAYYGMSSTAGLTISTSGGNDNVRRSPLAFASLPACAAGTEGSFAAVNDSTTNSPGATITGGGTNHVLGYCNAVNWIVAGGTGGGNLSGSLSSPHIPVATGASTLADSSVTDDGTAPTRTPNGVNTAASGNYDEWTVDTGGVTVNKLACRSSSNKVQICATSTTQGVIGVAQATATNGQTVKVCWAARCSPVSSNATTVGHWLIPSTSVAGDVDDTGSATQPTGTQTFLAESAVSGGAQVLTTLLAADVVSAAGGGKPTTIQINGSNNQIVTNVQDTGCTTFTGSNSGNTTTMSTHACHGLVFTVGDPGNSSALTVASTTTAYLRVPFACTIKDYSLMIDAGTITVKFWKVATGTAIPTSGNSINTSGVGISSGTAIRSTTLSDFTTTSVAANDFMAMNVTAVATAKFVNGVLNCQE